MDRVRQTVWWTGAAVVCFSLPAMGQTAHRFVIADEGAQQVLHIDENDEGAFWATDTPGNNRDLQLIGDNRLLVSRQSGGGGYFELDLTTGEILEEVLLDIGGDIQTARRLTDGHTVVAGDNLNGESGITVVELDGGNEVIRSVSVAGTSGSRLVRRTVEGTFLLGYNDTLFEVNWDGDVLTEYTITAPGGCDAYMTLRMPTGNTLTSCGYSGTLEIYDGAGDAVMSVGGADQDDAATIIPNFYAGFQVLLDGHVVIANWQGHGAGHGGEGVQLLEYDTDDGGLAWSWQDTVSPARFSSLHHVVVIDGFDTSLLHDDQTGVLGPVLGCTDADASNFSPTAVEDDGSCNFDGIDNGEGGVGMDADNSDDSGGCGCRSVGTQPSGQLGGWDVLVRILCPHHVQSMSFLDRIL